MLAVIDTNILVSALWSRNGTPAKVLSLVLNGRVIPCTDSRIMSEYRTVLERPKFGFSQSEINTLLGWFDDYGSLLFQNPWTVLLPMRLTRSFMRSQSTVALSW